MAMALPGKDRQKRNGSGGLARLPEAFKFLFQNVKTAFDIVKVLAAGEDDLPGGEDEDNDLRVRNTVDKAGKLFGLVLNILDIERDGQLVEVDVFAQIVRTDHVGHRNLGVLQGFDPGVFQRFHHDCFSSSECSIVTDTRDNDLAR